MASASEAVSGWDKRRLVEAKRIEYIALQLCYERGVDEITIEEIATVAGISRRTFYRYFNTIDDILTASIHREIKRILDAVRARPASENLRQAVVNAAPGFLPSEEDRQLRKLVIRLAQRYPTALPRAIGRIRPMVERVFAELVAERLRGSGQDDTHATLIARVLIGVLEDITDRKIQDGEYVLTSADIEQAFEAIEAGIAS